MFAALIFLWLFVWSVRSGQYDDSYTPSVRILFDDDVVTEAEPEKDSMAEKPLIK